jgi:predicted Zn-dependent protease
MSDRKEKRLDDAIAALPREIQPPRDLWPEIEARIRKRRAWRIPAWYGIAATLLLAIGAFAAWQAMDPLPGTDRPVADSAPPPAGTGLPEHSLLAAAAEAAPGTQMNPQTQDIIERNLRQIRDAMAEIEGAVEQDPNNPYVRALLADLYRHEAAVLATAENLNSNHFVRIDQ